MARGTRSPQASSAGPGRSRRHRSGATGAEAEGSPDLEPAVPKIGLGERLLSQGRRFTGRMAVIAALGVVLLLSYASSLQLFISQQHELALAEQQIADATEQIAELNNELDRWEDPAYVKAQARSRLGWVMPGETGYRVVDDSGEPLSGGVTIESEQTLPAGEHEAMWWDRMWGSLQTADAPKRKVSG